MFPASLVLLFAAATCSAANYDPDEDLNTPQIIRRHGYSVEAHTMLTDDGYLLTLHRITGSPNRQSNTPRVPSTPVMTAPAAAPYSMKGWTSSIPLTTTSSPQTKPLITTASTAKIDTSTQRTPTITSQPLTTTTAATTTTSSSTTTTTAATTTSTTAATTTTPRPFSISSPIFVQHGLLGSSADWILSGPGKALAYLLADQGYDVWLGNARGNTYSRAHATLSTSDPKYWDFSWHEMGYYDLPAAIDHVLNVTGSSSVFYVGHSMGTTMFYVMAATRPEYNDKVRAMFSLAPVAYMDFVKSPVRLLAPFTRDIEFIIHFLGQDEFLPQNKILKLFAKYGCLMVATEKKICENIIFLLAGFDSAQFNMTLMPAVLSHTPAGTSTKAVLHYSQEIYSGKFQQYDHGTQGNWQVYNQSTPPEYDLSRISTPIEVHYARNDWLASMKDVEHFYQKLKSRIGKYLVKLPEFNHLDFLWGKDAKPLVYDIVMDRIKALSPPTAGSDMLQGTTTEESRGIFSMDNGSELDEDSGEDLSFEETLTKIVQKSTETDISFLSKLQNMKNRFDRNRKKVEAMWEMTNERQEENPGDNYVVMLN